MKGSRLQKMSAITTFKVCDLKCKIINKHIIYKNSVYI